MCLEYITTTPKNFHSFQWNKISQVKSTRIKNNNNKSRIWRRNVCVKYVKRVCLLEKRVGLLSYQVLQLCIKSFCCLFYSNLEHIPKRIFLDVFFPDAEIFPQGEIFSSLPIYHFYWSQLLLKWWICCLMGFVHGINLIYTAIFLWNSKNCAIFLFLIKSTMKLVTIKNCKNVKNKMAVFINSYRNMSSGVSNQRTLSQNIK